MCRVSAEAPYDCRQPAGCSPSPLSRSCRPVTRAGSLWTRASSTLLLEPRGGPCGRGPFLNWSFMAGPSLKLRSIRCLRVRRRSLKRKDRRSRTRSDRIAAVSRGAFRLHRHRTLRDPSLVPRDHSRRCRLPRRCCRRHLTRLLLWRRLVRLGLPLRWPDVDGLCRTLWRSP